MLSSSVKVGFSLQQKMGTDSAVLTLVQSSFHHCGARTQESLTTCSSE